jgi:hypothetical protein
MWVAKKEEMKDLDNDINGHLPREDWPPLMSIIGKCTTKWFCISTKVVPAKECP